jgi:hypothetical protein
MTSSVSEPFLNEIGKAEGEEELSSVSVKELTEKMERKISDLGHATSLSDLRDSSFRRRPSFNMMPRLDILKSSTGPSFEHQGPML